jgi:hypothetical protein
MLAIKETRKSIEIVLEGRVGGDTVSKDWPIVTVNLVPAFEANLAPFSVVSCLSREHLQLPACLPSIKAASLDIFYPLACPVLGVVPRT